MKKMIMLSIAIILAFLSIGCSNKDDLTEISCKYVEKEDDMSVEVEMYFKRDNKENIVTLGQLKMFYDFSSISFSDEKEEVSISEIENIVDLLFSGVCDNLGDNYSDCIVNKNEKSAEVVMTFNLSNLAQTSSGKFNKNMSIEQIRQFIINNDQDTDMICITK